MKRSAVLDTLLSRIPEPRAVIAGVGATSGALWSVARSDRNLYNMDFAYPSAVALGLALARPDLAVVAVEGDGSALAGMSGYCTIAEHRPPNLTVVVFDNGVYGTGDGTIPTPTARGARIDLIAIGCGMSAEDVVRVGSPADAEQVSVASDGRGGFRLLVVDIDTSDAVSGKRPSPGIGFTEAGVLFQLAVRAGESR